MLVNLDFADLRSIISIKGRAMMGSGEAEGEDRALIATEKAISNPLLGVSIQGAKGLLINVSGGEQLTLEEVDCASERLQQEVGDEARVVVGTNIDNSLGNKIRVSVVATGLDVTGGTPSKTPETTKALEQNMQEPIIVTPTIVAQAQEESAVPADETLVAESVKTTLQTASESTFIMSAPLIDDRLPEETVETDDLFNNILEQTTTPARVPEPKKEEIKEETDLGDIIFPNLFNDETLKEKENERLKLEVPPKETFTQGREIPELPEDEIINIPAFLRRDRA